MQNIPYPASLHPVGLRAALRLTAAGILLLLAACGPTSSGTASNAGPSSAGDSSQITSPDLTADDLADIATVMAQVKKSYVEPVDNQQMVTNALKGIATRLDPHSDYMDAREYRAFTGDTEGHFGGLGMDLAEQDGLPQVVSPIDGTPASRAGIQSGDIIARIDGRPTDGLDLNDIVDKLRGSVGSQVTLGIVRGGKPPFDITLTRATIEVDSVKDALEPGEIGYVRISSFVENTQDELTRAIADLKSKSGGHLDGFILDLRNNPGGVLDGAIDVSGDFLNGGTVVSTRGREDDDNEVYTAKDGGDLIPGTPMLVLVNSASASASEIVAGALQDRRRARVMGTRSFGKGSVQEIIEERNGGALRLTVALYYTPSGNSIQGRGIIPDIEVGVPADEQVADSVVTRESDLSGALHNNGPNASAPIPAANPIDDRPIKPTLIGTAQDAQLAAAIAQLSSLRPASAR